MKIGIIGVGNIGGNCAHRLVLSGKHEVMLSFSRHPDKLLRIAKELGPLASVGTAAEAVGYSEVIIVSVPWNAIPQMLGEAGSLAGKIIIDTTNQYGTIDLPPHGQTAAEFNAARMAGSRYTKSFNTLTAGFQRTTADRPSEQKIVQWVCGDEAGAKRVVASLIEDAGYLAVDLGGTSTCQVMEAPRRAGAVYGEEYRGPEAEAVVAAVKEGKPIPPTPVYS